MRNYILFLVVIIIGSFHTTYAFNLPQITNIFKPPTFEGSNKVGSIASEEQQLLQAISNTGNGKDADLDTQVEVLKLVRSLETKATPSQTLLSNPQESKQLDGEWYLQYTAPSQIDADLTDDKWQAVDAGEGKDIETRQFGQAGSVSGGGISVDASNAAALQVFDIAQSRVMNEIKTGFGLITVGGTFRQSTSVPTRAVVSFDTAKLALDIGPTIDIGFLFDIRAALKNGDKESGWLETTYLSNDMRIGRGNKGSMFILTRDRDAN